MIQTTYRIELYAYVFAILKTWPNQERFQQHEKNQWRQEIDDPGGFGKVGVIPLCRGCILNLYRILVEDTIYS